VAATAASEPVGIDPALEQVRADVDGALRSFLDDRRVELAALDPAAAELADEIRRLVDAGGKRIRPSLCIWAARAAGAGDDPATVRAASALELLHTFALVHDDVMDDAWTRRGVETTHARYAAMAPSGTDAARHGVAVAILVGDLAAVLAEQLLRTSGAPPERLAIAAGRFDRMRVEMAAGQYLDLAARDRTPRDRLAALKTGSYTVEGPVLVGSALAGADPAAEGPLRVFGRHLGEAFQLRDDLEDGDAPRSEAGRIGDLVDRAVGALDGAPLEPTAARALVTIAGSVRMAEA
jgi:geranylgeranyl diphosphate synthase, type I